MINGRVDVRVEAVLLRGGRVPGRLRLLAHEGDPYDRLRALEAILPWNDHPDRGAILVRQHLAIHPEREQRERMKCLVEAEPLRVGPVEAGETQELWLLGRELLGIEERREGDERRRAERLDPFEEGGERIADPGNDHRPRLDTAERIDALLEGRQLQQVVDVEAGGLAHEAAHLHRPGPRVQEVAEPRRVVLVHAELVKVVVGRGLVEPVGRLRGAPPRVAQSRERPARRRDGSRGGRGEERTAVQVDRLVGHLCLRQSRRPSDRHLNLPCSRTLVISRRQSALAGSTGCQKDVKSSDRVTRFERCHVVGHQ